jgi:hypothetical protein
MVKLKKSICEAHILPFYKKDEVGANFIFFFWSWATEVGSVWQSIFKATLNFVKRSSPKWILNRIVTWGFQNVPFLL